MNLNQITVPSLNVATSIAFYQKLGFLLIVDAPTHYARFEVPEGGATFSIHLVDKLPQGNGIVVYFECKNLDAQVALLKEKGISFDQDPEDQSWLWREARLKDPDGNQIILYLAGDHRKNPPWRIN